MRKLFVIGFTTLALFAGIPSIAHAQASFIFGMIVGTALSSDGNSVGAGDSTANMLYLMPRAAERIKDPFALQTGASDCFQYGKLTFKQMFDATVYDVAKKEIVQILRVTCNGSTNRIVLWFVFTDRENIVPLDKLPPPAQK